MENDKKITTPAKSPIYALASIFFDAYILIIRHSRDFLAGYYDTRKKFIDVIGFIGVIAGLFLQIDQYDTESLKMVQAFMLMIFSLLLSILLIDFWTVLVARHKDTPKNTSFFSAFLSLAFFGVICNLFGFILNSFWDQILDMLSIIKPLVWFLILLYILDLQSFFDKRIGERKIISFMAREMPIWLAYVMFFPNLTKNIYQNKTFFVFVIMLAVLDVLQYEYKIISRKQNMLIGLFLVITIFYYNQLIVCIGALNQYLEKIFNLYL